MDLSEYSRAEAVKLSKNSVYSIAEKVAVRLGFSSGDDIHEPVEKLNGRVDVEDTLLQDPARSGSLYVNSPTDFRVVVPIHTSIERDRFTIAHELGHFVLHYIYRRQIDPTNAPEKMVAFRRDSESVEWEANWFAAAFLMPKQEFQGQLLAHSENYRAIGQYFGVSPAAARIRAKTLDK
jgi:Zn-dependent peptidase ImmA (M78 family)